MSEQYVPGEETELARGWEGCTLQQAFDEISREIQVRARCFPRWIGEGRVSKSDARDRLQRLCKAKEALERVMVLEDSQTDTNAQQGDV